MTAPPEVEKVRISHSAEHLGWVRKGRVPCLDGIRAISIMLVIMEHSRKTIRQASLSAVFGLFGGHLGVTCFFVISGFLVSLLLFRELDRRQTISLGRFYARRALRLLPAYVVYLGFVLVVTRITTHPIAWRYWCAALTYTMCYMPRLLSFWYLGHLWSLAVEEHFYFLWPILIFYLRPRTATVLAGACIILSPAIRYLVWSQHRDWLDIDFCSLTQMDSIATGCILGFFVFNYHRELMRILTRRRATALTVFSIIALVASTVLSHISGKYYILFQDPAASLLVAACVLGIWCNPDGLVHRWLNIRTMVSIGILSYSLYLWQQPFTGPSGANWVSRWPQNLLFILAAATASYWLVERPFLDLKDRFSAPKEPSRLRFTAEITC